jgi:hypothetical protein
MTIQATPQTFRTIRELPTTVKNYIEIGNIAFGYCTQFLRMTITADISATFSIVKKYLIAMSYNGTANSWQTVFPIFQAKTGTHDFDILIKINNGTAYFYLLRSAGTTAGNAIIDIELRTTDYDTRFNPTTGTGSGFSQYEYSPYENGAEIFENTNILLGGNRHNLSDWPPTGYVFNAPIKPDPSYPSLQTRLFPNFASKTGDWEGLKAIGLTVVIPAAMTNIIFTSWCRCASAPGAGTDASFSMWGRNINSGAAPSAWAAGTRHNMVFANNAYYQKFTDSHTLVNLGLVADRIALITWGRDGSNGYETCQKDIYCCSLQITFS